MNRQRKHFTRVRRRGSIYVFVLGLSLLVAVIGMSVLTVTQINARAAAMGNDSAEAAVLAQSAVEMAAVKIANTSSWRTTYTNGVNSSSWSLGRGTVCFRLVDPIDGDLANNTTDPVQIYGIGKVGNSTRVCSVTSGVYFPPLSSLNVAAAAVSSISFGGGTVSGSGTVATNGNLSGTGTVNTINLEAGGIIAGTFTGSGTQTPSAALRVFPDTTTVFDYYKTNAKSLNYSSIPFVNGNRTIDKQLLAPNVNTMGTGTSPSGIYSINCGGGAVTISSCRIVGTLLFLNAGSVTLSGSNIFEPAFPGYPVLLVQGNLYLSGTSGTLNENSIGTNLNPPGTPYPYNGGAGGTSNTIVTDQYPSIINGLVYCTSIISVTSGSSNSINGSLITSGQSSISGTLKLTYDPSFSANPAPGFTAPPQLGMNQGSWQWEQAP